MDDIASMKSVPELVDKDEINQYIKMGERADVFSRTALEYTFRLLRPSSPSVALLIQNILMLDVLPKPDGLLLGDKRSDNFLIQLEAEKIQSIIQALTVQASVTELKKIQGNITALGNLVILKAMLADWIELAKLYIDTEGHLEPYMQYAANS